MLAVALSAILLALGLAIRDEIEASRRSQFPWKQVQAASAKARRAAAGQGSK
jgi:hypothetical protein